MTERELIRLIGVNAYTAYHCALGLPRDFHQRFHEPKPGDLVVEISTIWFKTNDHDGVSQLPTIGVLLRTVMEPMRTQEELEKLHAEGDYWTDKGVSETLDDLPKEKVWYIAPLDGSVPEYRWTNADFIVIPRDLQWSRI